MAWKGITWSITFFIVGLIYSLIPTYMIVTYWVWLNELTFNNEPIYTLSLFMLFLWIVCILISIIYYTAMIRAIIQRKNDDLGISKSIKNVGLITAMFLIGFIVFWFFSTRFG